MRKLFGVVAGLVMVAGTAGAQSWTTYPDGSVGYTTPYSFTGAFSCGGYTGFVGASCANSSDGILLTSGDATIDLSFVGASGTLTATNVAQTLTVGTVNVVAGGTGPFQFPQATTGYYQWFFQLELGLAGVGNIDFNARPTGAAGSIPLDCCDPMQYFSQGFVTPEPAAFHYTSVVYDNTSSFTVTPGSTVIPLTTHVGLAPEPSTLALLATGLIPLIPMARRRRTYLNAATRA